MIPRLVESVTWIKVDKPTFDLIGVVLSSLGIAAVCAAVALGLGVSLGITFIVRARGRPPRSWADHTLHLLEARRPAA